MPQTIFEYLYSNILTRIRRGLFTKLISPGFYSVGHSTIIDPPLRFANLSKIQLGNRVSINRFCWIQALNIEGEENVPKIIIGDYSSIGTGATISAARKIEIGQHVLFASNVLICDHWHAYEDISKPIMHQGIKRIKEVKIGSNSWIGQNAVVLPDATIGQNCVIGANSVVNIDIPDYCVAAGIPARVIKKYSETSKTWGSPT